jgi:hypothetical protein
MKKLRPTIFKEIIKLNPLSRTTEAFSTFALFKNSTVDNTQGININYDPAPTKAFRALTKMNVLILERLLKLIYFENIFIGTYDI